MEPDFTGNDDIRRFEEQYRRNPDSLVFARLADACRKAGDPERALSILQDGIRRHPDYASAHIVRARALNDLDRHAEAEASLRRVLELDAQNLVAMRGLAGLAERRGDPVEAVHWFEQIVAHDPANDEAAVALERLRKTLPETPPGLEPLPAPREEWWSSPAFEIVDEERPEEPPAVEGPEAEDGSQPSGQGESAVGEPPGPEAASPDDTLEPSAARGGPWWFEDPAGSETTEEDGDLLTRTMAELYVKQGLVDEAAAIYRELLADRPDDEELRRALAELEADVGDEIETEAETAAAGAIGGEEAPDRGEEAEEDEPSGGGEAGSGEDPAGGEPPGGREPRGEGGTLPGAAEANGAVPAEDQAPVPVAPADSYASHPVPRTAAESAVFRDWIGRLRE